MQLARVVGRATATVKHPAMNGWRLLLVQPLDARRTAEGDPQLAIDNLGSGQGDVVLITTDGAAVRDIVGMENSPLRYAVIGIPD